MSDSKNRVSIDISGGLIGLLGVTLVILKLAGWMPVAAWSWWLVTLPFWFGLALFIAALIVLGIIALVCLAFGVGAFGLLEWWDARRRRNRYKGIL